MLCVNKAGNFRAKIEIFKSLIFKAKTKIVFLFKINYNGRK